MEKVKSNFSLTLKYIAIILLLVFCSTFFVGCMGTGGGGSSGESSEESNEETEEGGGTDEEEEEPKNPYAGASDNVIQNFNDVFLGAIGVYDVDANANVFYDKYKKQNVNFDFLIDRQFNTLSTVIINSLLYAYGDSSGTASAIETADYSEGTNIRSVSTNSIIQSKYIYNDHDDTPTLYYRNTISGGYLIDKEIVGYEEVEDEDGKLVEVPVYGYRYTDNLEANDSWDKVITSETSIADDLKAKYKTITSNLDNKNEINVVGMSADYKNLVLKYIQEEIIGSDLIVASDDALGKVFNGGGVDGSLYEVTNDNYTAFHTYKGYEVILPAIVDNAFKLIIDDTTTNGIKVGSKFSYESEYGDWDKTLFPSLARYEFIYYEDVDDICDSESNTFTGGPFDPETAEKSEAELEKMFGDLKPGEGEEITEESAKAPVPVSYKVGSKKKLKEIILLPCIDSQSTYGSKEGNNTFTFEGINISFAKDSGDSECRVQITSTVKDNNGNVVDNKQVKLDDGSYLNRLGPVKDVKASDLSGGVIVEYNNVNYTLLNGKHYLIEGEEVVQYLLSNDRVDFVTNDGYIIIEEDATKENPLFPESAIVAEGEAQKLGADIDKPEGVEKYVFGNCTIDGETINEATHLIGNDSTYASFKYNSESGVKDADGKPMNTHRLNVWNQLIKIGENGYEINFDSNYIKFGFNYYNSNNELLNEAPALYLVNLTFRD